MAERPYVEKEEPAILWEDQYVAVILKGPGWVCAVSRNIDQNKALWRIRPTDKNSRELVNSGKYEHLAHYVIAKWKDDKRFALACSVDHEFGIAHRLDVDTSGALMLGKTLNGFEYLRASFGRHEVYKEYICLCHGLVKTTSDQIELPIAWDEDKNISYISKHGQWAKSIYTVLGRYRLKGKKKIFTLCRVVIITGRTHQIRIHMTSIGHPLVSDSKYNYTTSKQDTVWCPRMFLHAWRVGFYDFTNEWREVKAPLCKDLSRALRTLEEIKIDPNSISGPAMRVLPSTAEAVKHVEQGVKSVQPLPPPPPPPPGATGVFGPPLPSRSKSNEAPLAPPPPPPLTRSATAPPSAEPVPEPVVRLPNGQLLKVPDYAPPPPPPPPVAMDDELMEEPRWEKPVTRHRNFGEAPSYAPPPPPPLRPTDENVEHGEATQPPPPTRPPVLSGFADGTAVADPIEASPRELEVSPKSKASSPGHSKAPAKVSPKTPAPPKDAAEMAALEESICTLAMRQILNAPRCQISVGTLGNCREIVTLAQKMGKSRPKLSKLLRDRSDTFTLIESKGSLDLTVSLTPRAMALGRAEQVSTLKYASDTFAAEATQQANKARERRKDEEERRLTEVSYERPKVPAARRWGADSGGNQFEDEANMLIDMGFCRDRKTVLKALRANNGDVNEAMDMLANMPSSNTKHETEVRAEVPQAQVAETEDRSEEEEMLAKAIAESQREAEARKRAEADLDNVDDQALKAAIAQSLSSIETEEWRQEEQTPVNDDERELEKALELSRKHEEELKRIEDQEKEELEQAIRESAKMYEYFHASANEDWEMLLGIQSAGSSSATSSGYGAEEEQVNEMMSGLYADDDDDDFDAVLQLSASSTNQGASSSSSSFAPPAESAGSRHKASSSSSSSRAAVEANSDLCCLEEGLDSDDFPGESRGFGKWFGKSDSSDLNKPSASASSSSGQPGCVESCLKDWAMTRMNELNIEFEREVLWNVIDALGEGELGDEEVVKLYLGFDAEDDLPHAISQFLAEFRQQKLLMQFSSR